MEINLYQLLAQSGTIIVIGGAFIKVIMNKVDNRIADNNKVVLQSIDSKIEKLEEAHEKEIEKLDEKRHKDKEQVFSSVNGIGEKVTALEKELALQKQTDERHDRELSEARDKHNSLETELKSIHEKILIKMEELKDLILSRIVK